MMALLKVISLTIVPTLNGFLWNRMGKKTILHVKLKKTLSSSDYKLFALKADRVAKRPERIVVDIQSGPIRHAGLPVPIIMS